MTRGRRQEVDTNSGDLLSLPFLILESFTMSTQNVMKAVITTDSKTAKLASDVAVPKLKQGEILIKVEAVTLNPTE